MAVQEYWNAETSIWMRTMKTDLAKGHALEGHAPKIDPDHEEFCEPKNASILCDGLTVTRQRRALHTSSSSSEAT